MADIEKVVQELPTVSEMLYQMYKDETDKKSISIRYDQYLAVDDALELLKSQQREIEQLKIENKLIKQNSEELDKQRIEFANKIDRLTRENKQLKEKIENLSK